MSRLLSVAICVLTIGVLLLTGLGPGSEPVKAAQTGVTQRSNEIRYQSAASPYDGTYSGKFNYTYQEWKQTFNGKWELSAPVNASIYLTVTMQNNGAPVLDRWYQKITGVRADDPAFGTGPEGADLSKNATASASLPLKNTFSQGSFTLPFGLNIDFPSGVKLSTMFPGMPVDDMKVDFMSMTISGSRWQASGTPKGHPLSGEWSAFNPNDNRFRVTFKDWSLKKIPSSTINFKPFKADFAGWNDLVYIRKKGTADWLKAGSTDSTVNPGDEIKTGIDSPVTLHMPDGCTIEMGPNSQIMVPDDWSPDNFYLKLLLGKVREWFNGKPSLEVHGRLTVDDITIGGKGTDFTVEVDERRAIAVTVLEGAVLVTDSRSSNSITMVAQQQIIIPKKAIGLSSQEMISSVKHVPSNSVEKWWEKSQIPAGEQTSGVTDNSPSAGSDFSFSRDGRFLLYATIVVIFIIGIAFITLRKRVPKS